MRFPGSTPSSHTSLNQMMHEGNESPATSDISNPLDSVVLSGAVGGSATASKDSSPKTEKEDEEKHKQREKTAYIPRSFPISQLHETNLTP